MAKKVKLRIFLLFYLIPFVLLTNAQQDSLIAGKFPPGLKVLKWLKGEPVAKFKKGHVYIVEFSATWCGPCRTSMPVLTSIAKKYQGEATVISVFIWENGVGVPSTHYVGKVERYVRDMKNDMGYRVAVDDQQQTMVNTWMKPSGSIGIPTAFVINKDGKIAWIGHPIDLGNVMKQIISGNFDELAAKKQQTTDIYQTIEVEIEGGEFEHALVLVDSIFNSNPQNFFMIPIKFNILLHFNEDEAYVFARKQLDQNLISEKELTSMCFYFSQLVQDSTYKLKNPDWELMFALINRGIHLTKSINSIAGCLDMEATLYGSKGEPAKAAQVANKGLLLLQKLPAEEVNTYVFDSLKQHYNLYIKQSGLMKN